MKVIALYFVRGVKKSDVFKMNTSDTVQIELNEIENDETEITQDEQM